MNLTSPTLMGIYSPTAVESPREEYSSSPWGTEAEAVTSPESPDLQETSAESERFALERARLNLGLFRGVVLPRVVRNALLFTFGVIYGIITMHLHENHWITPVKLGKVQRHSWQYLAYWGLGGVATGNVLPWLDVFWNNAKDNKKGRWQQGVSVKEKRPVLSWDAAVRSVGAFVGIAFALVSKL